MAKYPRMTICALEAHEFDGYYWQFHEACTHCGIVRLKDREMPINIYGHQFILKNADSEDEQLVVVFTGPDHLLARMARLLGYWCSCIFCRIAARYGTYNPNRTPADWQEIFDNSINPYG